MAQMNKKNEKTPLLQVEGLKTYFPRYEGIFRSLAGYVKAVDNVTFSVRESETVGLVGESGCGKTTCGRTLLRLIEPPIAHVEGNVRFDGIDVMSLQGEELKKMRRKMQIIFQDPYSSLNPRKTVMDIVGEPLEVHGIAKGSEKEEMVAQFCDACGLDPQYINRYPHEFSGGQRQRLGVARALALEPKFIVCDEPVSALDVSIQAQVINLLLNLREQYNLAYLFISHDLSVVKHISDRIAVMYLGKIVEMAPKKELFRQPRHPYSEALLSAVPIPDPTRRSERVILKGETPNPANPPKGCHFHPRCPKALPECSQEEPPLKKVAEGQFYRCVH